ncbi:Hypothetical protein, putative [Bodo saltans]|uniref:Uncharacterized protein n=1 Tax=Bodo saltans TaxID=75058 RepID=A0A0S4IZ75_BODSA|nr:Hypothetical protein, putative [Bodo saltans]|eukprot:CUG63159.1 Hypothetical protein, putative [Bodo saltans]
MERNLDSAHVKQPPRCTNLQLPPLPHELQHVVNPYLDPRGAIDANRHYHRISRSAIAAASERLSKPVVSKALELHDRHIREVTGERKAPSRPGSRSSVRAGSATPPPTLEALIDRYYSAPRAAQTQLRMTLERKHVLPIGGLHTTEDTLMTPAQVVDFIERNVSRPQSRAESRQSLHRASIAALQSKSTQRADHVSHFYTEQVQKAQSERDRVMSLYAKEPVLRPLSPADQKRSADRLSSAGKS